MCVWGGGGGGIFSTMRDILSTVAGTFSTIADVQ